MKSTALKPIKDPRTERAHKIDIYVGARIRNRRKEMEMSQTELAEYLNLTFQQVQKYERGANRVSASKLYEIAQKLQVHISYFYDGAPRLDGQEEAPVSDQTKILEAFWATPDGQELARSYLALPSSHLQKIMLDLMREMNT